MGYLSMSVRVCAALLTLAAISAFAAPVSAQLSGAIFTTDDAFPWTTNKNLYQNKQDVYVNGGPRKDGAAGLPEGYYYIRVTNPSGSVILGDSNNNPLPAGVGAPNPSPLSKTPIYVGANGKFNTAVQLWAVVSYIQGNGPNCWKQGYKDTPNNGGEYKVWVSQHSNYPSNSTKTDNFKVRKGPPPPPQTAINVWKFYDYDMNGEWADGEALDNEPPIAGWRFELYLGATKIVQDGQQYLTTDSGGKVTWLVESNGAVYTVVEILPSGDPGVTWFVTTGSLSENVQVADDVEGNEDVYFGNVARELRCTNGFGLTKGFWHNQNGRAMMSHCYPEWIDMLNDMCLRYPNGDELYINPALSHEAAHAIFESWIVGLGVEGNRAYALSSQLAAIALNVLCGPLSLLGDADSLFVDLGSGLQSFAEVFEEAVELLCNNPVAEGNDPAAVAMNVYQAFFDGLNNNKTESSECGTFSVKYWHTLLPIPNFYYN